MTVSTPFGFATAPAPAAAPGDPAPAAAPAGDSRPPAGCVVSWTEYDVYDELHPETTRYGLVLAYDEHGAALVLPVGDARQLAHFGPVPTEEGPHGPTVADLTVLGS
jgi:hypothetical protein